MEAIKRVRIISILKLLMYIFIEVLWCVSSSRLDNLVFIILMAILILVSIIKIIITVKEINGLLRTILLFTLWIIEIIIMTALLTLLYYTVGFDFNDILAYLVTCFIIILLIAEIIEFIRFLKTTI